MNGMVKKTHDMKIIWPQLERDIRRFVKCCHRCQQSKGNKVPDRPYHVVVPEHPFHHLYVDLTFMCRDLDMIGMIVVMDHLTKYAWAQCIPTKESTHVTRVLEEIFREIQLDQMNENARRNLDINVRTDNGVEFVSQVCVSCAKNGG